MAESSSSHSYKPTCADESLKPFMGELLAIANKLEKQLFSAEKTRQSLLDFQASRRNFPTNYPHPPDLNKPSHRTEIAHAALLAERGALYDEFRKKLLILDLERAAMEEDSLRSQLHNEFVPIKIGNNKENTRFEPPKALIQRATQLLPPVSKEQFCQFLFDFENNRRQAKHNIRNIRGKAIKIDNIKMLDCGQLADVGAVVTSTSLFSSSSSTATEPPLTQTEETESLPALPFPLSQSTVTESSEGSQHLSSGSSSSSSAASSITVSITPWFSRKSHPGSQASGLPNPGMFTPVETSSSTGSVTTSGPPDGVAMVVADSDLSIDNLNEKGPPLGSRKRKPEERESKASSGLAKSKTQLKNERWRANRNKRKKENQEKNRALLKKVQNQGKEVNQGEKEGPNEQ
jgi:hypothetical protein